MDNRIQLLQQELIRLKIDCLALNPGPSLTYLTGLHFHLMERPVVAFFTASGRNGIVLPVLEQAKLADHPLNFEIFPFGDDPADWELAYLGAFDALNLHGTTIGVEPNHLRVLELRFLEEAGKNVEVVDGSLPVTHLRMVKATGEWKKMRQAAVIAQDALMATLKQVRGGMSEKEIASNLVIELYRAGSDVELPFQPIVSTGPNSANPHAVPSDRCLQDGDLLLVDWGASKDGYLSDITRTFTFGNVDPELIAIGEIVLAANQAGRQSYRKGISAGDVDLKTRAVIEDAGYGRYFIHRTGHGLGMEAHEAPYIYAGNILVLLDGMTFTIEPGIYLPERGGVRIEDDMVVTPSGFESLTDLPRQVLPLESLW